MLGTYLFGGNRSPKTFEFLSNNSSSWKLGKTKIPDKGYSRGCVIYVRNRQEIWLIGGQFGGRHRILIFDINTQTFRESQSTLHFGRYAPAGSLIPGSSTKILVTGGCNDTYTSRCVEMIDIEDESVTFVGELTTKRAGHGIGTLKINGEEKLAVFGGSDIKKHVEIYDVQTGKWEEDKNLELREAKSEFGFLTL